jgi:hypothetical protein
MAKQADAQRLSRSGHAVFAALHGSAMLTRSDFPGGSVRAEPVDAYPKISRGFRSWRPLGTTTPAKIVLPNCRVLLICLGPRTRQYRQASASGA